MSKEFKGVWIPKEIYQDENLNPTEKLILSDIATLGEYFKSNETIAKEVGVSQCTVSRLITQLCDKGYIQTQFDGRTRLIKLQRALIKMIKLPYQIDKAALSNCKDSIQSSIQHSIHISKEVIYPFENIDFPEKWEIWKKERILNGAKKYTEQGEQGALHKLQKISNHDYQTALAILNESISNGWRGIFPLKEQKTNRPKLDAQEAARWANSRS